MIAPCNPTGGDDDLTGCATPGDDVVNGLTGNDTLPVEMEQIASAVEEYDALVFGDGGNETEGKWGG